MAKVIGVGGVFFTPDAMAPHPWAGTVVSPFAHILDPEGIRIELWQPRPAG